MNLRSLTLAVVTLACTPRSTAEIIYLANYQRRFNSGCAIGASWSDTPTSPVWRKDNMLEAPVGQAGNVETIAVSVPLDAAVKFVRVGASE